MASEKESNPGYLEDIPFLSSISPSIFVPTDRDFTKTPPPLSDDPVTRLEESLKELDRHAMRVEQNMVWMFAREAERIRRGGALERVQYDEYNRPITEDQRKKVPNMVLEEKILGEDEPAVLKLLGDDKYRECQDTGRTREDPRDRRQRHAPAGSREYADLATLRSEIFKLEVDELRQTLRQAALMHILNLVKWGWDEQLEGHRAAVNKEKEERRAELHRQIRANPFPLATTGSPASISSTTAATPPAPSRANTSTGGDAMDLDQ